MAIYTRPQILVLLAILATAGLGLAVGQWRRAYPELAERLERIEREGGDEAPGDWPSITSARDTAGDASPRQSGRPAPVRGSDDAGRWRSSPRTDKVVPGPEGEGAPIDLNAAALDDLVRLPGVGAVLAGRIVEAREAERFSSIDDLRRVRGLGRAKIERLRAFLTVAAERSDAPAPHPTAATPALERAAPSSEAVSAPDDVGFSVDDG